MQEQGANIILIGNSSSPLYVIVIGNANISFECFRNDLVKNCKNRLILASFIKFLEKNTKFCTQVSYKNIFLNCTFLISKTNHH